MDKPAEPIHGLAEPIHGPPLSPSTRMHAYLFRGMLEIKSIL